MRKISRKIEFMLTDERNILKYASDELKNDKDVIIKELKNFGWSFNIIPEHFKSDLDVLNTTLKYFEKLRDLEEYILLPDQLKNIDILKEKIRSLK